MLPWQRVHADLTRRLDAGEWAAGAQLPTVAALAEHYAVSPAVIQKAVRMLANDGKVTTVPRWGMFAGGPGEQS